ncbi:DNA-binding protein [Peribacillus muralis]|uniref:DNA-binding protein n=1 Tax=Peribacillus muralis TaxID=264697 RepID=UPI003D003E26
MWTILISEGGRVMTANGTDLPPELAKPAQRALSGAGYVKLEQFTKLSEPEILKLHGMGPKALEQLRRALAAKGLTFREGS